MSSTADKSQKKLAEAIAQGRFPSAYLFQGADDFRKDEALKRLLASAVDAATRDFNLDVRRGGELDAETLGSLLSTPPMMAPRRVVVIKDPEALKKGARDALDRWLGAPEPDVLLVLVAPAGAKADKTLAPGAEAIAFDLLDGEKIGAWIARHAKGLGVEITPEATTLLLAAVGNDAGSLAMELDKLASFTNGAPIDEDAVSEIVGIRRGETLGDLLDAVGRKDTARALGLVDHVLAQPKLTGVQVVMALATQMLALAWGRAKRDAGLPAHQLERAYWDLLKGSGAYTGRPWNEAVSAWGGMTMQWSAAELDHAIAALLAADGALKDTKVSSVEQIVSSAILAIGATSARRSAA
ncbi:MAG: DNA polymerase III subunit delta [Gemmatimonadetes bacterium]|nr:DNA polymerase III subunit delta [Gemmatimonadota bacterium]